MSRYVIERHPLVRRDLFEITRFIGDYSGYDIADKRIYQIEDVITGFEDFPHIGTLRDDVVPGLRAIPAAEKAVICFTVNDARRTVKIVCVGYAGQDWQSTAKAREGLDSPPTG